MPLTKEFAVELAYPFALIINAAIQSGRNPSLWKHAFVTPVPKIATPMSFGDLRPLSLTVFLSLLCESFVTEWLYADIAPKIDPQQFGNVKGSSTTHCLIDFLDYTYKELEKRKTAVVATFIDFKKAFDLVDHTTVIKKAISMGVRESLIPWLCDFLSNRQQSVRMLGATSDPLSITCGAPQGTGSGPYDFLMLINDALLDILQRFKYVDDCTIAHSINTDHPDYTPAQSTLDSLQEWTITNHTTINPLKCVTMQFTVARDNPPPPPTLSIGGQALETVPTFKLLGLTIDDKLKFEPHVTKVVKDTSYRLHMLRRLKSFGMPSEELLNIYKMFILPKLTYAAPAWGFSLGVELEKKLERVQKQALRICLGANFTTYKAALTTVKLPFLIYDPDNRPPICQEPRLPSPNPTAIEIIVTKFAHKLKDHPRHKHFLPPPFQSPHNTRNPNQIYPILAGTKRYKNSPIPVMVNILNAPRSRAPAPLP